MSFMQWCIWEDTGIILPPPLSTVHHFQVLFASFHFALHFQIFVIPSPRISRPAAGGPAERIYRNTAADNEQGAGYPRAPLRRIRSHPPAGPVHVIPDSEVSVCMVTQWIWCGR